MTFSWRVVVYGVLTGGWWCGWIVMQTTRERADMSKTREVVLFPRDGVWHAERVADDETYDLFGTTVLPTPFGVACSAEDVTAELEAADPGVSVDWFGSEAAWRTEVRRGDGRAARMAGVSS